MRIRSTKRRVLPIVMLVISMVVVACDTNPVDDTKDPTPSPSLDEQLIDVITIGGQRGLSNFILPESHEFDVIPQDPANPLTQEKVDLGRLLFHETGLATNPLKPEGLWTYSCATCHHAEAGFQAGVAQGIGEGGVGWGQRAAGRRPGSGYAEHELDVQHLRSPSVLNVAFQEVMGWSGKFGVRGPNTGTDALWADELPEVVNRLGYDGVESQAIAGMSIHRMDSIQNSVVVSNSTYQQLWESVFPGEPVSLEKAGLAIAAYERTLLANKAPFQRWLRGQTSAMTDAEKRGALVFFGEGACEVCHTGPALNQVAFYALGMPDMNGFGVAREEELRGRGGFLREETEDFKFKVPQIYNLRDSPFYGHGGTFRTIHEVVDYYNDGLPAVDLPADRLPIHFRPLELTRQEVDDLVAFLTNALYDPDLDRYAPAALLPSGNCTPANDPQARIDLGCD